MSIALKTKGELDMISFDDLYNKLKTLEPDVRSPIRSSTPSYSAFVSATSHRKPQDSSSSGSSSSYMPTRPKSQPQSSGTVEEILQSFVAEYDDQQQLTYEYFDQVDPLDLEEMNLKWQMAMLGVNVKRFEKKSGRKFNFRGREPARFDRTKVQVFFMWSSWSLL